MPGRDGTGPAGAGPMTGKRLGFCAGAKAVKRGAGLGLGLGLGFGLACRRGFGRGFGKCFSVIGKSSERQKELLQAQRNAMKKRLDLIDKRLENLGAEK